MPSRLADAHIEAQARLRRLIAQAIAQLWQGLPGYDDRDVDRWLSAAVPIATAGTRQSHVLTDAYLARAMNRPPLGLDLSYPRPVPAEEVYRRPFVAVWAALKAGTVWGDAVAQGLDRATSTAATDVQLASRQAFSAVQAEDPAIRGYQRVADPGACEFCLLVDGAFVKSADAMPLHNHCGCSLEPLEATEPVTPTPDGVTVHEHGELGPVLGDPAHDFTAQADL